MVRRTSLPQAGFVKTVMFFLIGLLLSGSTSVAQSLSDVRFTGNNRLGIDSLLFSDGSVDVLVKQMPLLSFTVNGKRLKSDDSEARRTGDRFSAAFSDGLRIEFSPVADSLPAWTGEVVFENNGSDTLIISNIVPFGEDSSSVYITGYGTDYLARASLFRPGFRPVRVILPDNAWELGYSSFSAKNGKSVCALARRQKIEGGQRRRYETILPPGSKVYYKLFCETFTGEWQEGLRLMFRDRYLYDLKKFDNTLFERKDLAWIRESYLIILSMAWDREFYDRFTGKYTYGEFLKKGVDRFGKVDVFCLWPTWPRLGLDQRNQWDLYRDLPGGTAQLRSFARMSRLSGTRFFISYNPWDQSTRPENMLRGMAGMIGEIEADGVVLDTQGSSSRALQAAADSVRSGVIMYSEGMAVTRDMPGIIAGRVHNAIYLSPELNLNKLIKPDFSIFRVCDVGEDIIHREIAIAFFNGYGTELNMYRPGGRNENYEEDLNFLSGTTFILRQNNDAFLDRNWTPLIATTGDNIFVNKWNSGQKTIYTVLNMGAEGFNGDLFNVNPAEGKHYVSLWNHENLEPELVGGSYYIRARADGWFKELSGTRREGSVDCIAGFPERLKSFLKGDSISFFGSPGAKIKIWKGNPSVKTVFKEMVVKNDTVVRVKDLFGYYEGKVVLQMIEGERLADENVITVKGGKPWLISRVERTRRAVNGLPDMVLVPGATFSYEVTTTEDFMPYPDVNGKMNKVDSFLIDKYPVTNAQYYEFLLSSGYIPSDTTRYLKHWTGGMYRQGQDKYPVVYVGYEDMTAYAKWAGKRLPTQAEWQLAAQGTDKRKWPWGNEFHGTFCNNSFDRPTPVDAFPKGQSPYGVLDLVGNVWQTTGDLYFNGTYYFSVIRGGSYFKPESSWWYIQGGPQSLDRTQIMLLVSPGFDRSSTVGFRCVKDIDHKEFRVKK